MLAAAPRFAASPPMLASHPARRPVHCTPPRLTGETFSALINLSGRRRFTSQRLVLFAVLAAHGREDAVHTAGEALTLFREAHRALVEASDTLPGVFCPELEDAYFGPADADRVIRDFTELAERTLKAIAGNGRDAPSLLDRLVQTATPLLTALNSITQVYEDLAKRHAKNVRKQLQDVLAEIESIARQARMVAFNAQIVAARAGTAGREFTVVAGVLSGITTEIDELVQEAIAGSVA